MAFDLTTGKLSTGFVHTLDGQGLRIMASPDGKRVYVGGDFTKVDGKAHNHLAAFDTATGALIDSFAPNVHNRVRAIAATDSTVYVGGNFFNVNGKSRTRLAAVKASDGSNIDTWKPAANDDEVYALTAYVLNLNDILPADASLDRKSILAVRMPNRDGFTTDHGFMTRDGKPDTHNTACMRNCGPEPQIASRIPEYAAGAHGDLAQQTRSMGTAAGASVAAAAMPPAELAKHSACMSCHAVTGKIVGPAFHDVAAKYAGDADAAARLAAKIRAGGAGSWGSVPMPPQPQRKASGAGGLP